jgi:phospholipid/cholesterol/gamma-HCH transport system permease protein
MNFLAHFGELAIRRFVAIRHLAAVSVAVLRAAIHPRQWSPSVRTVFARQILFTGVEAVPFVSLMAVTIGILVVLQAQVWLNRFGQSNLVGPILVFIILRAAGPLLTNFVVIGRSGSAITTELANMKVSGEIDLLDAQGIDPFVYLVVPRALSTALCVFCLAIVFTFVSLLTGYVLGFFVGGGSPGSGALFADVLRAIHPVDVFNLMAMTLVPGLMTGIICVISGLSVGSSVTDVPQAVSRGVMGSVAALFVTLAIVSLLTYF